MAKGLHCITVKVYPFQILHKIMRIVEYEVHGSTQCYCWLIDGMYALSTNLDFVMLVGPISQMPIRA
jgi:hypothetical protein